MFSPIFSLLLAKRKLDFAETERAWTAVPSVSRTWPLRRRNSSGSYQPVSGAFSRPGRSRPEIRRREVAAVTISSEELPQDVELAEIAGSLGLSPTTLQPFKKETGNADLRVSNKVRIEEAIKPDRHGEPQGLRDRGEDGVPNRVLFLPDVQGGDRQVDPEYRRSLD
jgi:hypothetical protein